MTLYKFAKPFNDDEAAERFELLDDRGDRMLVRSTIHCVDWEIRPTEVYPKSELERAQ